MAAPDPKDTATPRRTGPIIGALAVLVFLGIGLFVYLTFEPEVVEDEAAEETAPEAETE